MLFPCKNPNRNITHVSQLVTFSNSQIRNMGEVIFNEFGLVTNNKLYAQSHLHVNNISWKPA